MKIRQIKDSMNQHVIAIEKNDKLRCFFKNYSMHAAQVASDSLRRDIARHGESVVDFETLPAIYIRVSKAGKTIYDVE